MEKFIGHNKIINGFEKRVHNNTLSHAHLISGEDGIGKSILADIFASNILNKEVGKEHVDSIEYRANKATIGVDEVRKIIEEVNKRPYEGDKKVITIYNGEKLTIQAQNALLKTIEEPPSGVYIIIITTTLEVILETIRSRCQTYKLTPLNRDDMIKFINRHEEISEEKLLSALAYSEGIPGEAERFLIDSELGELRELVVCMLKDIVNGNTEVIQKYEKIFEKYKNQKEELLVVIETFIRDIIVYKELHNKKLIINSDKKDDIEELLEMMSYKKLEGMLKCIKKTREDFKNNTNYLININIMLMVFLEV